jgi:hypothetical protein
MIQLTPHLFAVLLFIFGLEYIFYELRMGGVRLTGVVLRLALFLVGGLMVVYFMSNLYAKQFLHKTPVSPEPVERVLKVT